jgi:hypothetical protein
MMKPGDIEPFAPEVHDYVDGRMSSDDERDFTRRLRVDPVLRGQVEHLRAALKLLHDLPPCEPPVGFEERLRERLHHEDLAERARKRILPAPTPWWQPVVQIGAGGLAAAVLMLIIGVPGWRAVTDSDSAPLGLVGQGADPLEADLLPKLAEQYTRFESLRRNITYTQIADSDKQRELLRLELQLSGLHGGNPWLAGEVSRLPAAERAEYMGFVNGIESALERVEQEISESRRTRRAVNMLVVRRALHDVQTPQTLTRGYRVRVLSDHPDGVNLSDSNVGDDVRLYAKIRQADYRHDPQAMLAAANAYLRAYGHNGTFSDQAAVAAVAALLRMGSEREAAMRYNSHFPESSDTLSIRRTPVVEGLFTSDEKQRLQAVLNSLSRRE